jgi:hypothetical protein
LLARTLLPTSPMRFRTCADKLALHQAPKRSTPSTPVLPVCAPQQRRWKTERPAPRLGWACECHQCTPLRGDVWRYHTIKIVRNQSLTKKLWHSARC